MPASLCIRVLLLVGAVALVGFCGSDKQGASKVTNGHKDGTAEFTGRKHWTTFLPELRRSGAQTREVGPAGSTLTNPTAVAKQPTIAVLALKFKGTGLCNQLYELLNGIALAAAAKIDLEMPPLFSVADPNMAFQRMAWRPLPLEEVLDVDYLRSYWNARGLRLIPTRRVRSFNNVSVLFRLGHDLRVSAAKINAKLRQVNASPTNPYLVINKDWGEYALGTHPLLAEALSSIRFTSNLVQIADKIIKSMGTQYTGLHLRVEIDYVRHPLFTAKSPHHTICRTIMDCFNNLYLPALEAANFSHSQPMYIATGLFREEPAKSSQILEKLKPYASSFEYNARHFQGSSEEFLNEQLSAIDLMVLAHSQPFIGNPISSLSSYVTQYRKANNIPGEFIAVRKGDPRHDATFFLSWP